MNHKATDKFHNAKAVAETLQLLNEGLTYADIHERLHVSFFFIGAVRHGNSRICPQCGKTFYPLKDSQRYGSKDCYNEAVRALGT